MKLLIDIGNTRLKWAVYEGRQCQAEGAVAHGDIPDLAEAWQAWPVAEVWGASVARAELRAAVEGISPLAVCWVSAQRAAQGITNHYRNVAEQGADRWLAVLAARSLEASDVVVACAGTALTVEALSAEGDYLGGLILPGQQLMRHSLARGTAQLDRPAGEHRHFPQGTEDAIASGIVDAQAGAIERMRARLQAHTGRSGATVLLTGGDAAYLLPHLAAPVRIVDNLVILGLLSVANTA